MTTSGTQQYPKLRVIIRAEKVLGQRMFVIDMEQEQNNNGLDIPRSTNQENSTSFDDEDITDAPQPVSYARSHHKSVHKDELEIVNPEAEFPGWRLREAVRVFEEAKTISSEKASSDDAPLPSVALN